MTALNVPVDQLDDETARTPAWQELRTNLKRKGTLPKGTFDAVIRDVATVRRRDDRSHVLRVIVRTIGLDRDALVWQGLADGDKEDPFDLTVEQIRGLQRFAERLGINASFAADNLGSVVQGLVDMRDNGEIVQLKVTHTKVGPRTSLYREAPVIVPAGQVPADTQEAAQVAQEAHQKVLDGLHAVNLGLACAAEGCYLLHQSTGWRALGYDTLREYLAAPEVTMSRSMFYALSLIWQRYVLDGGLEPTLLGDAERTKLEVPLPALGKGVVTAEKAVADAASLTRTELEVLYAELCNDDSESSKNGKESRRRDVQHVPVDVARRFVVVLRRVLAEVGAPEQKRMGQDLRGALNEVLELAREQGLDVEEAVS
jgi:hypothetical protein